MMKKVYNYKKHKPLDEFCKKYPFRLGEWILLYTMDYRKDEVVNCLLVYYAACL